MKPTFKNAALAILISLGVTGCLSHNNSNPADDDPKPIQPNKNPEVKPEVKPEQPKPEVKPEQPKPEQPKPEVKPEQPKPELYIELDKDGKEWRNHSVNLKNAESKSVYSGVSKDHPFIVGDQSPLYSGENQGIYIDYKELAKQNGGDYFGVHQATYHNDQLKGRVESDKDIHALFVNQPYSTYGILYTQEDITHPENVNTFPGIVYIGLPAYGINNGNESVESGSAIYKGKVLASISTMNFTPERAKNPESLDKPFIDGNVTLNAQFSGKDKGVISGEIESNTLGRIILNETTVSNNANNKVFDGSATISTNTAQTSSGYRGQFFGPNNDDVTGYVDDINIDNKQLYRAVFGGTKQK